MNDKPTIAIIGGTGAEGSGLAFRLAHAGYPVIIGSRDAAKAEGAAAELNAALGGGTIRGMASAAAAEAAAIALLTVPYAAQQATALDLKVHLRGKILIDATVPLVPPRVGRVQLPEGGSAVAKLQELLGAEVKVVAAFQNVSAHHLKDLDHPIDCDVLVCADDVGAAETAIALAKAIGLAAYYAGPVANSAAVEALTSVLITINRRHKVAGSGIRITGLG